MSNVIRDYVEALTPDQCIQIVREVEEWERTAVVADDAALRQHAEKLSYIGYNNLPVITMNSIATEVFRRLAYEYAIKSERA